MTRLGAGGFGPNARPLEELTDAELHQELARRRRARNPRYAKPPWHRLRQYFANLELSPGASLSEVERAYKRLTERYHPDRHKDDPERHKTARELMDSLTEAYNTLVGHLKSDG